MSTPPPTPSRYILPCLPTQLVPSFETHKVQSVPSPEFMDIHQRMVDLPGHIPLNKTGSPFPSSHQSTIAPQLGMRTSGQPALSILGFLSGWSSHRSCAAAPLCPENCLLRVTHHPWPLRSSCPLSPHDLSVLGCGTSDVPLRAEHSSVSLFVTSPIVSLYVGYHLQKDTFLTGIQRFTNLLGI